MTHINQRRDTSANWTSSNPVLQLGEVGHETNTRRYKLGDGATAWNDLDYSNPAGVVTVNGRDGDVVLNAADVGLGAVDNTDDASKPISGPQQNALNEKVDADYVNDAIAAALVLQRPVGSLYLSTEPTNPATYFGGTWIAWGQGRVPVGIDVGGDTDFDTAEETGGSKTHSITSAEMPAHTHPMSTYATDTGSGALASQRVNVASGDVSTSTNPAANPQTGSTGSGTAMSLLQPYIVCYIWKRTS